MAFILYGVAMLVSVSLTTKAKTGAFECGFVSLGKIMISYSCHFYVLALLFVVFDMEVVLFAGLSIASAEGVLCVRVLALGMICTFYLEWALGSLSWKV